MTYPKLMFVCCLLNMQSRQNGEFHTYPMRESLSRDDSFVVHASEAARTAS